MKENKKERKKSWKVILINGVVLPLIISIIAGILFFYTALTEYRHPSEYGARLIIGGAFIVLAASIFSVGLACFFSFFSSKENKITVTIISGIIALIVSSIVLSSSFYLSINIIRSREIAERQQREFLSQEQERVTNLALSTSNFELCYNLTSGKESCIYSVALNTSNNLLCNLTGNNVDNCYYNIALETNNVSLCFASGNKKDSCIKEYSGNNQNIFYCGNISDDNEKFWCECWGRFNKSYNYLNCYQSLEFINEERTKKAIKSKNVKLCDTLFFDKDTCIVRVAIALNKPELCDSLNRSERHPDKNEYHNWKYECYYAVALLTKNLGLCDNTDWKRIECIESIYQNKIISNNVSSLAHRSGSYVLGGTNIGHFKIRNSNDFFLKRDLFSLKCNNKIEDINGCKIPGLLAPGDICELNFYHSCNEGSGVLYNGKQIKIDEYS